MQLDSTEDVITYFLTDIVPASESGVEDAVLRNKAARFLQTKVTQYWEPAWKMKETQSTVQFAGDTGLSSLPDNFSTWDRNFGLLVWGPPNTQYRAVINPTKQRPLDVMAMRIKYPTQQGTPVAVARHNRILVRWPTLPPGGLSEDVVIFYHRTRPNILDLFGVAEEDLPGDDDPQDEWSLIPLDDQEVIVEGLRAMWDAQSGDGREAQHEVQFRKRCRELFKSRNQDQQPQRFSQPFNANIAGRPNRVGDRYYT